MTIDNFFTSQTAQGQASKGNIQPLGKSSSNLQSNGLANGLDYFGAFLQNILETSAAENTQNATQTLAVNEGVEDELAFVDNPTLADVIALNQKALEAELAAAGNTISTNPAEIADAVKIKNALLSENANSEKPALNNLHKLLQRIEALDNSELSALNITPQQLTQLQSQIKGLVTQIENGDLSLENIEANAENFGGLLGTLVNLQQPQTKQDNGFQNAAARLSAISIGVGDDGFPTPPSYGDLDDFEQMLQQMSKGKDGKGADIADLLQNAGKGKSNGLEGMENAVKNANTSALQGWPFSLDGSLFSPMSFGDSALDAMGLPMGQSQVSSLRPLTSLVTQSPSAGHQHPGTQSVAASISKMAGGGEAKNIRIQLDPPELGRVEIKMTFNKDKTVKAVLTAEKPETFMMLQRDSQALERALQEAGIETDGSELSFELADDNQDFGQDGSHDGARNKTGNGNNAETDEDIIETTMTWHVDPESGHMRYNILV